MSLRELTTSELSQVSGAGCGVLGMHEERATATHLQSLMEVAKLYSQVDPRYRGMDYRMVAATEPSVRRALIKIVDDLGAGGKETANAWANGCW